jgi:hypothetical protein
VPTTATPLLETETPMMQCVIPADDMKPRELADALAQWSVTHNARTLLCDCHVREFPRGD